MSDAELETGAAAKMIDMGEKELLLDAHGGSTASAYNFSFTMRPKGGPPQSDAMEERKPAIQFQRIGYGSATDDPDAESKSKRKQFKLILRDPLDSDNGILSAFKLAIGRYRKQKKVILK